MCADKNITHAPSLSNILWVMMLISPTSEKTAHNLFLFASVVWVTGLLAWSWSDTLFINAMYISFHRCCKLRDTKYWRILCVTGLQSQVVGRDRSHNNCHRDVQMWFSYFYFFLNMQMETLSLILKILNFLLLEHERFSCL